MMGVLDGEKAVSRSEQAVNRSGERRYDKETKELCTNIEQFLLARADPNKDINEFRGRYPYARQQMKIWTDGLKVKMGEDAAKMFINSCMDKAEAKYGGADKPNGGVIPSTGQLVQPKEEVMNIREEYPPEPSPSPMPAPPPNIEDMEGYQEGLENYWIVKNEWDNEVARIDFTMQKLMFQHHSRIL